MNDSKTFEYREGFSAFISGLKYSNNPYDYWQEIDKWNDWSDGFLAAERKS